MKKLGKWIRSLLFKNFLLNIYSHFNPDMLMHIIFLHYIYLFVYTVPFKFVKCVLKLRKENERINFSDNFYHETVYLQKFILQLRE